MTIFYKQSDLVTSSAYHDAMMHYVTPLYDYLGVNHLWYYKITSSGLYSYLGTHTKWNEYCFENAASMIRPFPCLRHPDLIESGINLMKATEDIQYQSVLETAWEKFKINFNINFTKKTATGIEAFGFGTKFRDLRADQRLLNELPLLHTFIKMFKHNNKKLFQLIDENPIDLSTEFGSLFFERSNEMASSGNRDAFLRKMGFHDFFSLTQREIDVLKYLLHGYPASYISENLLVSKKTVENYIANIKWKLGCHTKVQLIEKAKEIDSFGFFAGR
jgi:DNA-binding CsgD family transcriptional regulator